ncbi:bifunctional demethylmenaquinone methyltransfera se/2-methoxy-6-polyprenyl-1,4-benzoquinol methylase [Desulfonema ishimotonii]|uniref:Demethylmenaquinone methyltransferase n=1 Tax=Desulfonema ishimotonii TaxID=45657 RepID=A0A401FS16_9BACT|nr:class I SAM-dependent methyltransferase [Desulfonema ishimotonii]GBC59743.1 bifunctional demethylmenaquinone methyltransfera se/2-methoxy-6-polyprenyl-1,4-benzoquinol methylase [Desulfonema ishimotonii]
MQIRNSIWFDRKTREKQLDDYVIQNRKANFGTEALEEDQKAGRVRRHFDSVASRYDMMNTLLSFGVHYLWKRTGIRMLELRPGEKVLDVCGGTGDLSVSSRKIVGDSGQVALYDINWEMMKAGRLKPGNSGWRKKIAYIQGDAEQIAFPDNTFDVVMVGFAVRNITHMKQAFSEMHRVLKPGGRFLCLEFSKPVWPWFRWLYDFYSFSIMPLLGDLMMGERKAYTCLPETIRLFLTPDELTAVFRGVGFSSVVYRRLTNGIAVAHLCVK